MISRPPPQVRQYDGHEPLAPHVAQISSALSGGETATGGGDAAISSSSRAVAIGARPGTAGAGGGVTVPHVFSSGHGKSTPPSTV